MIPDNIKNFLQVQKNNSEHTKGFGSTVSLILAVLPSLLMWCVLYLSSHVVVVVISVLLYCLMFIFWFVFSSWFEREWMMTSYLSINICVIGLPFVFMILEASLIFQSTVYLLLVLLVLIHFIHLRIRIKKNYYGKKTQKVSVLSMGVTLVIYVLGIVLVEYFYELMGYEIKMKDACYVVIFLAFLFLQISVYMLTALYYYRKYKPKLE